MSLCRLGGGQSRLPVQGHGVISRAQLEAMRAGKVVCRAGRGRVRVMLELIAA